MPDQTIQVSIENMKCGSCSYKIECEVGDLPGVKDTKVDLPSKLGTFVFDDAQPTGSTQIVNKINELGFPAKLV